MMVGCRFLPILVCAWTLGVRGATPRFNPLGTRSVSLHKLTVEELHHESTRARVVLLIPEYDTLEKGFAISFRTPVPDESGVAHVTEHLTLSGSQKHPVRFPLSHFSRSSMATFVNAMTYIDHTTYPVATINTEDLYNLASVYLDSVFDSLALTSRKAFEREGWHLEKPALDQPLKFQGIVYNEMKGSYSDPRSLLFRHLAATLLPDTPYALSSGGWPSAILSLTYEQFLDFYYRRYHPSNAIVYYFGKPQADRSDLNRLLGLVDEYLTFAADRFDRLFNTTRPNLALASEVKAQTRRFGQPMLRDFKGPVDQATPQNMVYYAALLGDSGDTPACERLGLELVAHLLVSKRETPMYQRLLEAKLGTQVVPWGVHEHGPHIMFTVGVTGVDPGIADAKEILDSLINEEIDLRIQTGFDAEATRAALNRFEFSIRESVANVANRPMIFLDMVVDEWVYDRDPLRSFEVDKDLQCLRDHLMSDPHYLQSLMRKYFRDGVDHHVVVRLTPDASYDTERDAEERRRLDQIEAALSPAEIEALVAETAAVKDEKSKKDTPEALATMPVLPLSAVQTESVPLPTETRHYSEIPVIVHDLPTAGIAYNDIWLDLYNLTLSELMLLQLGNHLVLHGDRQNLTARDLSNLLESETGGVSLSLEINSYHRVGLVGDPEDASAFLSLDWRCLNENMEACVAAVETTLAQPDFQLNQKVATQYLKESIQRKETRALSSPSHYAKRKYDAHLSLTGRLAELTDGLSAIPLLKALKKRVDQDWATVAGELDGLWRRIFSPRHMVVNIGGDDDTLEKAQAAIAERILEPLLEKAETVQLSETAETAQVSEDEGRSFDISEGLIYRAPRWALDAMFKAPSEDVSIVYDLPSMVAYNYFGGHMYSPGTPIKYKHVVPAKILSLDFVFPKIRFEGGGYGASFGIKLAEGKYTFSSYRDPHIRTTYEVVLKGADEMTAIAANITQTEIEASIVRAISALDQPKSPSQMSGIAFLRWLFRDTPEHQDQVRRELFNVTPADFSEFARALTEAFETRPKVAVTFGNMRGESTLVVAGMRPFEVRKAI